MTVKDFAASRGVTTQAVYKLLKNHAAELDGHIETRKRVKYLDEYAQNYLIEQMNGNPVVTADNALQIQIEELKQRLERKDVIIERLQERESVKDELIEQLKNDKFLLEQKSDENDLENQQLKEELEQERAEKERYRAELEAELNKGFFQRLFRK